LSRLATSFVLGYHGCDKSIAQTAVNNGSQILDSDRDYDWLGPGAYFWEADPQRAKEWADWKVKRGEYKEAAVVGAVIDLRHCLDLVSRKDIELLRAAHRSFIQVQQKSGLQVPQNLSVKGRPSGDKVLRYLDCAVFRHLHEMLDSQSVNDEENLNSGAITPFDTVRGMFVEGGKVYRGSGIYRKSHVQISVRNPDCIKGIFFPLDMN